MRNNVKKVLNAIIDIIVILIMIVSVLVVVLSITTKNSGVPNLFGYAPLSVLSDSMENTIMENDVILSEITNDPSFKYEVGDIVTFPIEINGVETYNTHRIVEIEKVDSVTYYITQGDNKESNPVPDKLRQTSSTIVAKWTGKRIPKIGGFLTFIRTQLGFFLCVLLPMILFFVYEAIRVIFNIIAYNKEKATEEAREAVLNSELTEEQKQRAIEEYLSKQKAKENESEVQTPAADDNSEAE